MLLSAAVPEFPSGGYRELTDDRAKGLTIGGRQLAVELAAFPA